MNKTPEQEFREAIESADRAHKQKLRHIRRQEIIGVLLIALLLAAFTFGPLVILWIKKVWLEQQP